MGWYDDLQERVAERRKAIAAGAFGAVGLFINLGENARLATLRGKWVPPPDWWDKVFVTGNLLCVVTAFLLFACGGWYAPWPTKRLPLILVALSLFAAYLATFGWNPPIISPNMPGPF